MNIKSHLLPTVLKQLTAKTHNSNERARRISQLIRLCELDLGRQPDGALKVTGPEFARWFANHANLRSDRLAG